MGPKFQSEVPVTINSNHNNLVKLRKSTVILAGFLLKPITFREKPHGSPLLSVVLVFTPFGPQHLCISSHRGVEICGQWVPKACHCPQGPSLAIFKTWGMTNFLAPLLTLLFLFSFFLSCIFSWTLLPLLDAHLVEKSRGARTWSRWKSLSGHLTTGYSFPSHPILGWRLVLISMPRAGVTRVGNSHVNTKCCDNGCNLKGERAGMKLKKITHNKGTSVLVCWEFRIVYSNESGRKEDNKIRHCVVNWTVLK